LYNLYCVQFTVPLHAVYFLSKRSVGWRIAWPCSVASTFGSGIFYLRVCVQAVGNRDLALELKNLK